MLPPKIVSLPVPPQILSFPSPPVIVVLEVVDSDKYASSFDSVRIIDLIGRTYFERYYYKFIIKDISENERERLFDVLKVSRTEPPFLIAKKNEDKKIILSGHFNVKYEKDNRSYDTKIKDIREKLKSLMEDEWLWREE